MRDDYDPIYQDDVYDSVDVTLSSLEDLRDVTDRDRQALAPVLQSLKETGYYAYGTFDDQQRWSIAVDDEAGRVDARVGRDGIEIAIWTSSPGMFADEENEWRRKAQQRLARIQINAISRGQLAPHQQAMWDEVEAGVAVRVTYELPFTRRPTPARSSASTSPRSTRCSTSSRARSMSDQSALPSPMIGTGAVGKGRALTVPPLSHPPTDLETIDCDAVVVGAGVAGLAFALSLPSSWRVALLTKGRLGESNTRWAQGGISAAIGPDDSPDLHEQDTLVAGAGLCDAEAVRELVQGAGAAVDWLIEIGAEFDRDDEGSIHLGREAAHSRRRVLHAGGDATGAEVERALVAKVRTLPNVAVHEGAFAVDLVVEGERCAGLLAVIDGRPARLSAPVVAIAAGGAGRLWATTSNPPAATGDGLAIALRAGAAVADLEFVQFHPTGPGADLERSLPHLGGRPRRGRLPARPRRRALHAGRAPAGRAGPA
jgi:hypothetical protein